jgi:hypothetical protein
MEASMKREYWIGLGIAVALLSAGATAARAQSRSDYDKEAAGRGYDDEAGPFSIRMGLGFMADPTAFLLGFEGDYRVADQVSLGGLVHLGLDDDLTMVSPVAYGRYRFELGQYDQDLEPVVPYLQAGLGFSWWDVDDPDDDEVAFLMNFGFGVEYEFDPHLAVGSQMLFNIMPTELDVGRREETFYYTWEVVGLRYRF